MRLSSFCFRDSFDTVKTCGVSMLNQVSAVWLMDYSLWVHRMHQSAFQMVKYSLKPPPIIPYWHWSSQLLLTISVTFQSDNHADRGEKVRRIQMSFFIFHTTASYVQQSVMPWMLWRKVSPLNQWLDRRGEATHELHLKIRQTKFNKTK